MLLCYNPLMASLHLLNKTKAAILLSEAPPIQSPSLSSLPSFPSLNSFSTSMISMVFPGDSDSEEFFLQLGHLGLMLGSERSPGVGNGNPLQYSCLENFMDRGAWWATVQGCGRV